MPQYTPEQRNFLVMAYERYKGTRDFMPQINQEFQEELPGVEVPHRTNIVRMYKKQMTFCGARTTAQDNCPGRQLPRRQLPR